VLNRRSPEARRPDGSFSGGCRSVRLPGPRQDGAYSRAAMNPSSNSRLAALLMLIGAASACTDHSSPPEPRGVVQDQLREAFETANEVAVIVNFREPSHPGLAQDRARHRATIRQVRDSVLSAAHQGFTVNRQYEYVPAIAGRLTRTALESLAQDPNVSLIQLDETGHGALKVSVPAIGGDVAKTTYNVTGKGVTVAVLDTGANSSHPDLRNSIAATQHCFTHSACPPNNASEGTSAEDDHGHGSHVSGIITSDGAVAGVGFAPGAEIIAVKIDDSNDSGYVSDWVAGLDWVYSNLSALQAKVVNLSICSTQLYGPGACDSGQPALAKSVTNLINAGVTIFAASGNDGSSTQLTAPACLTGVIAVGATYKSDQGRQPASGTYSGQFGSSFGNCSDTSTTFDKVACFTNSNSRLDLLAPGAGIVSDLLGSQTGAYWGTSQASPTAAGVAALMLECNPNLTPANVKDILIRTGVTVTDPKNSLGFPSIRADAAVKEACASRGGATSVGGNTSIGSTAITGGRAGTGGTQASGGTGGTLGGAGGTRAISGGASNVPVSGGKSSTGGISGALSATGGTSSNTGGNVGTGASQPASGASSVATTATGGARVATGGTSGATGGVQGAMNGGSTSSFGGQANLAGNSAMGGQPASAAGTSAVAGVAATTGTSPTVVTANGEANVSAGCSCGIVGVPASSQSNPPEYWAVLIGLVLSGRRRKARRTARGCGWDDSKARYDKWHKDTVLARHVEWQFVKGISPPTAPSARVLCPPARVRSV
jgi:subtilisin family serine protease